MKIALISDVHANLPALKAALSAIQDEAPDLILHSGDAIAIGPYPAECVDQLSSIPNLKSVRGNHEQYFLNGIPDPQPNWMSPGEVEHQVWTREQLGTARKEIIGSWPLVIEEELEGIKFTCQHYGLTPQKDDFQKIVPDPDPADLERIFQNTPGDLIAFGHDHSPCHQSGSRIYLNPGSLGCSREAQARFMILEVNNGELAIHHHQAGYEDRELRLTFQRRDVPEREFIFRVFYGGRFQI